MSAGQYEARRSITFTFVREPVSRFLAAVNTTKLPAAIRSLAMGTNTNQPMLQAQVALVTSAVTDSLLKVGRSSIDFIGHFEDFDSDWRRMRHFLPNWPVDETLRIKARSIQADKVSSIHKARSIPLCRLLLPDYVCFGYQLPSACAVIQKHNVSCPLLPGERWESR